jgi:AhpD family alkylhydroperoxidase
MTVFPDLDLDTAPAASRPLLAPHARRAGGIPSPLARMAASPLVLSSVDTLFGLWGRTSLTPLEREAVVMTVARINDCHWCIAMHTGLLGQLGAAPAVIAALRDGVDTGEPRLDAAASFTAAVMAERGAASDAALAAFTGAGYTAAQALEVVLGVAVFTLTTYANRLTRAPLPGA